VSHGRWGAAFVRRRPTAGFPAPANWRPLPRRPGEFADDYVPRVRAGQQTLCDASGICGNGAIKKLWNGIIVAERTKWRMRKKRAGIEPISEKHGVVGKPLRCGSIFAAILRGRAGAAPGRDLRPNPPPPTPTTKKTTPTSCGLRPCPGPRDRDALDVLILRTGWLGAMLPTGGWARNTGGRGVLGARGFGGADVQPWISSPGSTQCRFLFPPPPPPPFFLPSHRYARQTRRHTKPPEWPFPIDADAPAL